MSKERKKDGNRNVASAPAEQSHCSRSSSPVHPLPSDVIADSVGVIPGGGVLDEHSHHDDNDVDVVMMRLPSPITVHSQQGEDQQDDLNTTEAFPDLPPLRGSVPVDITAAGSAAFQDLRSRLISHDSWFLLFPSSTRNTPQPIEGDNHDNFSPVNRSRSSDDVAQRAISTSLLSSGKSNDTEQADDYATDIDDATNSIGPNETTTAIQRFHSHPPTIPPRARFATHDGAISPGRNIERSRLSSYGASSLRFKLERVSSSSGRSNVPVWTLRRGSLLHNNEVRPSYMQTLVLKRQLKQHYTEIQRDAQAAAVHAEAMQQQQQQDYPNQKGPISAASDVEARNGPTDSAMAQELLRQVESFEESQSRIPQQISSRQISSVESEGWNEGVELMTSASCVDATVPLVEDHRQESISTFQMSSLPEQKQNSFLSRNEQKKDLQELAKQVLVEDDVKEFSHKLREIHNLVRPYLREGISADEAFIGNPFPLQVRIQNMSYKVKLKKEFGEKTASDQVSYGNSKHNMFHFISYLGIAVWKYLQRVVQCQPQVPRTRHGDLPRKEILKDINLVIEPGLNYLILGPPGSGKSVLLKAIAGLIPLHNPFSMEGSITYNGKTLQDCAKDKFFIENAFGYIDQLDDHAPLMTVKETLNFAYQCKTGGKILLDSHERKRGTGVKSSRSHIDDDDIEMATPRDRQQLNVEMAKKVVEDELPIQIILTILGLTEVQDTFVGNSTTVRGVSGGQRRRVTVGEMIVSRTPILCGDEISTGLDAASTFDMIETLLHFGRIRNYSRVFALLQPSPEVVSLFDQIIVLSEGHILYAGKIEEVEGYFAQLGFRCPEFVDLADFLQLVSTEDRETLYQGGDMCPTVEELANYFKFQSEQGADIQILLNSPHENKLDVHGSVQTRAGNILQMDAVRHKYANGFFRSLTLITRRFLLLWFRDRKVLAFSVVRNIINGASVGGAFFNTTDFLSIQGAMFQTGIFVLLGSLQSISGLVSEKTIYDKQANANFFSAWPYVLGKSISQIPQTFFLDTLVSGATLYYMIGLGGRSDFWNFVSYALILFSFATLTNQQMAAFASFASESKLQVYAACFLFFSILFGGYIISGDAIPTYFIWLYYLNPFQWAYNALILNEVYSGRYENPQAILEANGFVDLKNAVLKGDWIWWGVLFLVMYFLTCTVITAVGLTYSARRRLGGGAIVGAAPDDAAEGHSSVAAEDSTQTSIVAFSFQPVTLTFQNLSYEVKASTSNEKLQLLKGISGVFHPGRMCALMGESGAGKTTLMDVIALRKNTGSVVGSVFLNGWPQDPTSFRRCSGYVEQFDVQSPELTVLETVLFSARMRLDPRIVRTEEMTVAFCKQVLTDVELDTLAHSLVGNDNGSGLSFEQKKRLSIAVELAASPSVLFLDEPTSGLDARSALLITRLLRKLTTSQKRTIVATIHQPSSAVFELFDDLLLLKKGGEMTFHGPLGTDSVDLIDYFECEGAIPIELGDNPANWILRVMQDEDLGDLAQIYKESELYQSNAKLIEEASRHPKPECKIQYDKRFATNYFYRQLQVNKRLQTIYWRSPTYNLGRLIVSLALACFLGMVFGRERKNLVYSESDIKARISVIFFSNIIIGILAMISVQPVMTRIRDVFYRHRDAGMYDSFSLGIALGFAESFFICASSGLFCIVFISSSGLGYGIYRYFGYWGFFTFNSALFSYFGQLFVTVVKSPKTAMVLSGVYIGFNNLFSGLVIPPQQMVGTLYAVTYYMTPGHYVFEGEVTTIMWNDARMVVATTNSDYYDWLVDKGLCIPDESTCLSSQQKYLQWFFGGEFTPDNIYRNLWILALFLAISRFSSWLSLKYLKFS
ncbi:ABC-2 type transporter [Nitzschia inconspicua]|uniref:ABC-2 type transporter n=1 Tax=Nitzschia inconspicua TaxID=303405 RepID=A0A9K3PSX1_9STRA|nr:ABC-2 type transporter [Nitzschia inconspicua]